MRFPGNARDLLGDEPHTRAGMNFLAGALSSRDFGVSMSSKTLEHKKRDGRSEDLAECFWAFASGTAPQANVGARMYVASGGRWVGFFVVSKVKMPAKGEKAEVIFQSESWVPLDGVPRSPFRGFTYKVPTREVA